MATRLENTEAIHEETKQSSMDIEWLSKQTPSEIKAFQEVISKRNQMCDVSEEFEIERQRRLFSLIKHTSKFRQSLVEQANQTEQEKDKQIDNQINAEKREARVTFAVTCFVFLILMKGSALINTSQTASANQEPKWKSVLCDVIDQNKSSKSSTYVQLATVRPNGRPANRTLVFRGFFVPPEDISVSPASPVNSSLSKINSLNLSDAPAPDILKKQTSFPSMGGFLTLGKLASMLTFVTDSRSSKCVDELVTNKFGEICWYFPETREQFRLSGTLHVIANPLGVHAASSVPPWAPKSLNWEGERQRKWREIGSNLRATFLQGQPGKPISDSTDNSDIMELDFEVSDDVKLPPKDSSTVELVLEDGDETNVLARSKSLIDQLDAKAHDEAFANFALLLFDVDLVDHVVLSGKNKRTVYKMNVPERTYGRIAGIEWEVTEVNP
ncbi:hypothetical protein HK096_009921 [Nowakowskiella sp. JEL0078]|nr:hypothetical protein HK096_009921 [Nowakowskiella sp. JEL0078]